MLNRLLAAVVITVVALPTLADGPNSTPSPDSIRPPALTFVFLNRQVIETRILESPKDNKLRERELANLFVQSGCTASNFVEQPVKHSSNPNVICTLPGSTDSVIIVSAHFDKVPTSSGIIDNWSGASLLPSLYHSMAASPRKHTFVFVGFTDEELGMVGSQFYVKQLTPEQRSRIRAVINMDTLGLHPTEVWATHSDPELINDLAHIAAAIKLPVSAVNVDQVGSTDSESFAKFKIPRITIHSVTQQTWHILHTPDDNPKALHMDEYYDTYRLMAAYLTFLDTALSDRPSVPIPAPK